MLQNKRRKRSGAQFGDVLYRNAGFGTPQFCRGDKCQCRDLQLHYGPTLNKKAQAVHSVKATEFISLPMQVAKFVKN